MPTARKAVTINPQRHAELTRLAEQKGFTLAAMLNTAILYYLDNEKKAAPHQSLADRKAEALRTVFFYEGKETSNHFRHMLRNMNQHDGTERTAAALEGAYGPQYRAAKAAEGLADVPDAKLFKWIDKADEQYKKLKPKVK